jgi:hypothetical protein
LDSAEGLKYIKAIRNEFEKEIQEPSDEIVRLFLVNSSSIKLLAAPRLAVQRYTKHFKVL